MPCLRCIPESDGEQKPTTTFTPQGGGEGQTNTNAAHCETKQRAGTAYTLSPVDYSYSFFFHRDVSFIAFFCDHKPYLRENELYM